MIKLVFSGKCEDCELRDLTLYKGNHPGNYTVHCTHETACERIEKLHKADLFYGPGGEGRREPYDPNKTVRNCM